MQNQPQTTPNNCSTCKIHHLKQTTPKGAKLLPQRKLDIHTETEIICKYCKGKSTLQLGHEYPVTFQTINNILRRYKIPLRTYAQAQRNIRGTPTLTFPLSTEIPQLAQTTSNLQFFPHFIAICLLTDGGAGRRKTGTPYITFTNKALILHKIFTDLIYYYYHQSPSAFYRPYWSRPKRTGAKAYYTTYNRRQETEKILLDLFTLSPSFRTRPKRGQPWTQYLKEQLQPTLQFLLDQTFIQEVNTFIIRLAMSTEGSISPIFTDDSRYPYPHLTFGCKHPKLKQQWTMLFHKLELPLKPTTAMLESGKLQTAQQFLKLGGFLPGILSRQNSYYHGIERNHVLRAILENREQHSIDPKLPRAEKHAILRKRALKLAQTHIIK